MTAHSWKDIQNAAVAIIQVLVTAGTIDLESVSDVPFDRGRATTSTYPLCRITRGNTRYPQNYITGTEEIHTDMIFTVITKADTTDDKIFDIGEKIIDTMNANITITSTCIACYPTLMGRPDLDEATNYKEMQMIYDVQYWRDF